MRSTVTSGWICVCKCVCCWTEHITTTTKMLWWILRLAECTSYVLLKHHSQHFTCSFIWKMYVIISYTNPTLICLHKGVFHLTVQWFFIPNFFLLQLFIILFDELPLLWRHHTQKRCEYDFLYGVFWMLVLSVCYTYASSIYIWSLCVCASVWCAHLNDIKHLC